MEANPYEHGWPHDGFFGGGRPEYSDFIRDIAEGAMQRNVAADETDETEPASDEPGNQE